jgi:hypothetical protein
VQESPGAREPGASAPGGLELTAAAGLPADSDPDAEESSQQAQ